MEKFDIEIKVSVKDKNEALIIAKSLKKLATNIDTSNLELLAEKSSKLGINTKIQMFKNMI